MIFDSSQPSEDVDHILVAILDETYGDTSDDDWPVAREGFRRTLEADFGLSFADADIGPGASFPAFAALLEPLVLPASAAIGVLIAGKPIREGLDNWLVLAGRLRKLFQRRVYLNRNGAAALAIEAVAKQYGSLPRSIQLVGYQVQHVLAPDDLAALDPLTEIADAPGTIYLGALRHIFEFDVEGATFRVSVEGRDVKTLRLPTRNG